MGEESWCVGGVYTMHEEKEVAGLVGGAHEGGVGEIHY